MQDKILRSLFLDEALWAEVLSHGVDKGLDAGVLERMQDPHGRAELCRAIACGTYTIAPPRTGYRPKEDGGERTFFANAPCDRLLLNAVYKWLLRNDPEMIHPACLSYQEGIGTGRIVKRLSRHIASLGAGDSHRVIGRKFDIHKYFESVDRRCIHQALDAVEQRHGRSSVIDLLRRYYDSDCYYDTRQRTYCNSYQGIKQGCAVSAWLADVILYPLDEAMSALPGCYVRYSDDIIYIGEDYEQATAIVRRQLDQFGLSLNEHKLEDVRADRFVRFLGFAIRGGEITLSQKWVKEFQRRIELITVKDTRLIAQSRQLRAEHREAERQALVCRAARRVARFLYWGDGEHAWATQVLSVVNRPSDVRVLSLYCMDALRAVYTGRTSIGGLGFSRQCGILRGKGRHVKSNRAASPDWLEGFCSLLAVQRCVGNRWLYRTLTTDLLLLEKSPRYCGTSLRPEDAVAALEEHYGRYLDSRPDGRRVTRFYARPLEDMDDADLLRGGIREAERLSLESFLEDGLQYSWLQPDARSWYWQSPRYPQLVLLRSWFAQEKRPR